MPRKKGFYPTPRDLQMTAELGDVLLMDVPLFQRHFPLDTTGDSCLRRLRQMTNSQLVAQVASALAPSPRSAVYRLTERGAAWLSYHSGMHPRRVLHAEPKPISIPHRLLVARIVLGVNDAATAAGLRKPGGWLLDHDRLPEASCSLPIPHQYVLAEDFLPVPIAADRPIEVYGAPKYGDPTITLVKVRPDAACLLPLPGESATHAFYVEADNGTEAHTQLLRKLPGYHALFTTRAYRRHWPDHSHLTLLPRVLFVFRSAERLANLVDRLRIAPTDLWQRPAPYQATADDAKRALAFLDQHFRFTTLGELQAPGMLALPIWRTVTAQGKAICPRRTSA